jgi:hypothetical protein
MARLQIKTQHQQRIRAGRLKPHQAVSLVRLYKENRLELRKIAGPVLVGLLGLGLVAGFGVSAWRSAQQGSQAQSANETTLIRGLVGSEKEGFYRDPRVIAAFKRLKMDVQIEKAGSREMATRADLKSFDFGHPAGSPAAQALQKNLKAAKAYNTFYTPIAIASWRSLMPVLEKNQLVKQQDKTYYLVNMPRLFELISEGKRWKELNDNSAYPSGRSILVSTTDVRKSNSAAMYLGLASYVLNGNEVVQNTEQVARILPKVAPLFLKQGFQESSSAGPFEDYVSMGIGKAPLVLIYEAQYFEHQTRTAQPNPDMVLLYPQPTIYTKHLLVPFNDKGNRVGEALSNDAELQKLAAEYGYRGSDVAHLTSHLGSKKMAPPPQLVEVIDPPSQEILEAMILGIAEQFKQ